MQNDVYWFRHGHGNNRVEIVMPKGYCLQDVWDKANALASQWDVPKLEVKFGLVSIATDEDK